MTFVSMMSTASQSATARRTRSIRDPFHAPQRAVPHPHLPLQASRSPGPFFPILFLQRIHYYHYSHSQLVSAVIVKRHVSRPIDRRCPSSARQEYTCYYDSEPGRVSESPTHPPTDRRCPSIATDRRAFVAAVPRYE
jgi:hypothetical protein